MTTTTFPARLGLTALLVAAALGLAGCGSESAQDAVPPTTVAAQPSVRLVPPTEAAELVAQEGVRVLDVRTAEEFAEGHVVGAQQLDWYAPDFAARVAELDHAARWVVYCRSGNRSGQATALMAEQGFTAVADVDGGIVAWQAAGLPVEPGS